MKNTHFAFATATQLSGDGIPRFIGFLEGVDLLSTYLDQRHGLGLDTNEAKVEIHEALYFLKCFDAKIKAKANMYKKLSTDKDTPTELSEVYMQVSNDIYSLTELTVDIDNEDLEQSSHT